jgi:chemotaxis protein CheC
MKRPVENKGCFNELELSALKEVGNILASSYVSAIGMLTNMAIYTSVPAISVDMAGAIMSVPATQFGKDADAILYIKTAFNSEKESVIGDLFLIPDEASFDKLLKAMGVVD